MLQAESAPSPPRFTHHPREASGIVPGIGVFRDHVETAAVNADSVFGDFVNAIQPLIEGSINPFMLDFFDDSSK